MSRFGAAFLAAAMTVAIPAISSAFAAEAPHRISHNAAWGCRDKGDLFDLLFLGISSSFDTQLAAALADGRCVAFAPGESVTIVEQSAHGIIRVQRGVATTVSTVTDGYWTLARNVD